MSTVLKLLVDRWAVLAKTAAWLAGIVTTFLISPPQLHPGNEKYQQTDWLHFSQFVLAILLGLYFINAHRTAAAWRRIAIFALAAGIALFLAYQILMQTMTCRWMSYTVVAGYSLSRDAKILIEDNSAIKTGCDAVYNMAGKTLEVWPLNELVINYILISLVYSLAILALSASAMATVEHVRKRDPKTA